MRSEEYYKGRASVWKDLYKQVCQHAGELQSKVEPLEKENGELKVNIIHLKGERENLQMQIQSRDHNLERYKDAMTDKEAAIAHYETLIEAEKKKFAELLEWVMSRDNRSAEERLRSIRAEYKDQWAAIKPQK